MISVCVPTFNRYDLLQKCVDSAFAGTVKPDAIVVVDNGLALADDDPRVDLYTPPLNLGVAATWNWFIKNVPEYRIIVNDDIEFHADTIEKIVEKLREGYDFVRMPDGKVNCFSCFGIADTAVEKIGYFDENISPRYAYYEDNDYMRRMMLAKVSVGVAITTAFHGGSQTLKKFNPLETSEHWRKFELAKANYIRKWGGEPNHEIFNTPYNR
jgi:GT2 family glycosyltransferase